MTNESSEHEITDEVIQAARSNQKWFDEFKQYDKWKPRR